MPSNWFRARSIRGEPGIAFRLTYDTLDVNNENGSEAILIVDLKCRVYDYPSGGGTAVIISKLNGPVKTEVVGFIRLSPDSNDEDLVGKTDETFTSSWAGPQGTFSDHPQIALVLDGVWQEDPMQAPGTHNFNFAWNF